MNQNGVHCFTSMGLLSDKEKWKISRHSISHSHQVFLNIYHHASKNKMESNWSTVIMLTYDLQRQHLLIFLRFGGNEEIKSVYMNK